MNHDPVARLYLKTSASETTRFTMYANRLEIERQPNGGKEWLYFAEHPEIAVMYEHGTWDFVMLLSLIQNPAQDECPTLTIAGEFWGHVRHD